MRNLHALFRFSLAGLRALMVATLVLGVLYPLVITGIAQSVAPWQANGSLITDSSEHTTDADDAVGSALLGQLVDDPAFFQPRPSAAGDGYDPLATSGSNLGPESPDLVAAIEERQAEVAEREGVDVGQVPPDAVTASASGLDPDISPAYAALQVARVAAANDLDEDDVRGLVAEHTTGRVLGILGEPVVNVLELNTAVTRAAR
ncbi:MAG: potassium-transporting ATPase subunit KdpC [Ornithinimicrobium sp.]